MRMTSSGCTGESINICICGPLRSLKTVGRTVAFGLNAEVLHERSDEFIVLPVFPPGGKMYVSGILHPSI